MLRRHATLYRQSVTGSVFSVTLNANRSCSCQAALRPAPARSAMVMQNTLAVLLKTAYFVKIAPGKMSRIWCV